MSKTALADHGARSIDWVAKSRALKLEVRNFIDGRWAEPHGELLDKYGPRDGQLLYRFGAGTAQDVAGAVDAARQAFEDGRWSKLSVQHRKETLCRLAFLIRAHHEELALLEALDVGKPITQALSFDVSATAATIQSVAEATDKLYGKVFGADASSLSYQLYRPVGVVAGIVGWNFPMLLASAKIGAALATGNSLVLKPSEVTSLATARLAELALEAGVPPGVFNVIHGGPGLGAALAHHADIDLISFTGSSATGKKLLIASGESNMKRLILECGGKAPNIVFDDSPDLEAVADAVVMRAFYNQGQVCSASSRLLIQESVKEKFLSILSEKVSVLKPGDPLQHETTFAALVSQDHRRKVLSYVESGIREGAHVAYRCDASAPIAGGFYVPPVIFDRVNSQQKIAQEEIFGPVLSVLTFRDEKEAIEIANGTIYGLSAILWTQNLRRAHRMVQGIRAGWIVVNATDAPRSGLGDGVLSIGGHKQSGMGVEGGIEGLESYVTKTAVQLFI